MPLCVLDYFRAGHLRKRLGGIARCAGKPDARFATILCEQFTEDIGAFADICGQRSWRRCNGIDSVLLSFDQPLLARTAFHGSLDKSFLFIQRQITRRLSRGATNPDRNGGSSKTGPINLEYPIFMLHGNT